jgi:hypothetical protein
MLTVVILAYVFILSGKNEGKRLKLTFVGNQVDIYIGLRDRF